MYIKHTSRSSSLLTKIDLEARRHHRVCLRLYKPSFHRTFYRNNFAAESIISRHNNFAEENCPLMSHELFRLLLDIARV